MAPDNRHCRGSVMGDSREKYQLIPGLGREGINTY
jgi:hypothetical protein